MYAKLQNYFLHRQSFDQQTKTEHLRQCQLAAKVVYFETKQKEQDEIRREQRLIQKEIEKRARFDEIDKNLKSSSSGLENFNIDKSKEN